MKVLLDHCVDRRFARLLSPHEVATAAQAGWSHFRNGALLQAAAAAGFEAVVTTDAKLRHEENPKQIPLPVIVLRARTNRLADLAPLAPTLRRALEGPLARAITEIVALRG